MYPYQYPCQGMYPYNPMAYGNYLLPCVYPGSPEEYRSEELEEKEENSNKEPENTELSEEARGQGAAGTPGGMQAPAQAGKGHAAQFPTGMPMQPGMMQPGMMTQSDIMAQLGALQPGILQQDAFSAILRQIQAEAPQILSALISLGVAIETIRQSIIRIVESADKAQK